VLYKRPVWINHYLHRNVQHIVSDSNGVTAAIALRQQGTNIPIIAFHLWWKPESIDH
jgi:hypothetical protein